MPSHILHLRTWITESNVISDFELNPFSFQLVDCLARHQMGMMKSRFESLLQCTDVGESWKKMDTVPLGQGMSVKYSQVHQQALVW